MKKLLLNMNEAATIEKLKKYQNAPFAILSVFLGRGGKKPPEYSDYMTQLNSLIHQNLTHNQINLWKDDLDKIRAYLAGSLSRSNVRSLVFFSAGNKLWEVLGFEFALPPVMKVSNYPYTNPIEEALKVYQKYLVLLTDRRRARLFTVHLGKIEEHKDFYNGEVPQKVKAKKTDYGRDDKIPRHIEDHLRRHLQLIALAALKFAEGKNIHYIILGGHKELLPEIKKHLLYPLNKMVLGEFITELNIPLNRVLLASKKIAERINQSRGGSV